jgi:AraC family transcriptional regulator
MVGMLLPASTYAVFTHVGSLSDLLHTINYIWGTWVPRINYLRTDCPDFELFDSRFDSRTGYGEFDIYLPVQHRASYL